MCPNYALVVVHGLLPCLVGQQRCRAVLSGLVIALPCVRVLPWNGLVDALEVGFCLAVWVGCSLLVGSYHWFEDAQVPVVVICRQS
jgi:hypothetical protein